MAEHEHTSKDIASQASKVLSMTDEEIVSLAKDHPGVFRSIAASALTQSPDRTFDRAIAESMRREH